MSIRHYSMISNPDARRLPRRKFRHIERAHLRSQVFADLQLADEDSNAARPHVNELPCADNITDGPSSTTILPAGSQCLLQRPTADHAHVTHSDTDACLPVDRLLRRPVTMKEDHLPWKRTRTPVKVNSFERSEPAHDWKVALVDIPPLCTACSMPRSTLGSVLPRHAVEDLSRDPEETLETDTECLFNDNVASPWGESLRRCWGALTEALDELGNVWDGHDDRNGQASSPELHVARKELTKYNSEEPGTPKDDLRLQSLETRPSHYDTLTPSPVGSRSSKRGRKPRLRHKSPAPARNTHDYDIDHAYSTEDGNNDPHIRLKNKLLFQKPFGSYQDDILVFTYKQDSRKGSADPDAENNKPVAEQDQEGRLSDHEEMPSPRRRAPVADTTGPPDGDSRYPEPLNMAPEVCRHGVPVNERTCERLHEANSDPSQHELAQQPVHQHASQEESHVGASRSSRQHANDNQLRHANYGACEASTEEVREDEAPDQRIPTPDNLREGVHEIFEHHALHGPPTQKTGILNRIKEATRPRHAEVWPATHVHKPPPRPIPDRTHRSSDGSPASESQVPLLPKKGKVPRRYRELCIVSSASVPPERNTTDLLSLPFGTLQQSSADSSQPPIPVEAGEMLMSTHGIRRDIMMAETDALDPLCSADEAMVRTAAMGSMSWLNHIDANTRTRNLRNSLAKQDTASTTNMSWHKATDATEVSHWTMPADFADSAASFRKNNELTTIPSEQRATVLYNLHNMYQGIASAESIRLAVEKHLFSRKLQGYLNHV